MDLPYVIDFIHSLHICTLSRTCHFVQMQLGWLNVLLPCFILVAFFLQLSNVVLCHRLTCVEIFCTMVPLVSSWSSEKMNFTMQD